jgi:hypothetical protein
MLTDGAKNLLNGWFATHIAIITKNHPQNVKNGLKCTHIKDKYKYVWTST